MPLREQSRIKADTVAEECTCEECPAPASDGAPPGFRIVGSSGPGVSAKGKWVRQARSQYGDPDSKFAPALCQSDFAGSGHLWGIGAYDILEPIPAPAPEPSAPPAGVPVCHRDCGKTYGGTGEAQWASSSPVYATRECAEAERCLNPPPSDPVPVATGGVPTGFRLGDGWYFPESGNECSRGFAPTTKQLGCQQEALYSRLIGGRSVNERDVRMGRKRACAAHAVEMGALVPIDTARSVPPGPVPLEARPSETLTDLLRWQPTAAEVQAAQLPAAPASEPAVRPLSEALRAAAEDLKRLLQYRDADGRLHSPAHGVLGAWKNLVRRFEEVAALEAERDALSDSLADERLTSARARTEVEQLRGKLADAEKEAREWQEAAVGNEQTADERVLAAGDQATARVRSMREAAATATRTLDHAHDVVTGRCSRCAVLQQAARGIERLPLDTGTATDTAGEAKCVFASVLGLEKCKTCNPSIDAAEQPQADAIKAAVDKANNRAADALLAWKRGGHPFSHMKFHDFTGKAFAEWLRSGEDAPGAVGK